MVNYLVGNLVNAHLCPFKRFDYIVGMNKIDFKTSGYFTGHIIFLGVFLLAIGLPLIFVNVIGGLILCFISLVILTTHYRLNIDLDNKTYHDYLWILGFRNGEKGKFNALEYLFIKMSNVTQTMRLRVVSSTIRKEVFDGYLKFSEHDKIHLLTMDSKESLIKKLKSISSRLKVRIIDYSEGNPKEI